jgi:hypothetical protein
MNHRIVSAVVAFGLLSGSAYADNLADIKAWRTGTVPASAVWNVNGFKYDWHISMVQAGRRLIPSVILPTSYQSVPNTSLYVTPFATQWTYSRDNALPLLMRMNNLPEPFSRAADKVPNYRLPLVPESIPLSPLVWWYQGTMLNDKPQADFFGPNAPWKQEGGLTATSAYSQAVFAAHPSPAFVMVVENNEANDDDPFVYVENLNTAATWKSAAALTALSIRMKERVDNAGYASDPWELWPELFLRRRAHYTAFFKAYKAASPAGWQNLTTGAYAASVKMTIAKRPPPQASTWIGHAPEAICYDGSGPSLYPGEFLTQDLTSIDHKTRVVDNIAAWDWLEARNAKAYRAIWISMKPDDAMVPAQTNLHEVVSPDVFRAWCEWLAWIARKPGVPVLLHHWITSTVKPTDLFFVAPHGPTELAALGRSDLATTTHGDYAIAPAQACDSICRAEVRDFWNQGVTVPATAPAGVHVVAVKHAGKTLIYVWTPKALTGELTVTVDGVQRTLPESPAPSAYWMIEPPTAETIREIE